VRIKKPFFPHSESAVRGAIQSRTEPGGPGFSTVPARWMPCGLRARGWNAIRTKAGTRNVRDPVGTKVEWEYLAAREKRGSSP